ncbi:MAG: 1-(5-phosphoribosyl)-5-[(5-phosphoribosylamino)methylideneamino] imidazole-4-carboxamide isomerase [Candidatus Gracilibacteria bacterium]|jgi:phosphoribosylformimino-5-aminoimidazole carboxamide ribotide isomerase|nr:1-(5-phosphoribosyl)-5-[(5-phosphoribosylamino)methylideneamino] imidazole-4-carboxamide isomerase [Candidatus Gracilibacteria bacterium]
MNFKLLPAIDLIEGRATRLLKGDFDKKTQYDFSLKKLAEIFSEFGDIIHIVDLDGAKNGFGANKKAIQEIVKHSKIPTELGGGIRSLDDIQKALDMGISRVILGSIVIKEPNFLEKSLNKFTNEQIVLSMDIKDDQIAINAWENESGINYMDFLKNLKHQLDIEITDIQKDGMLQGASNDLYRKIKKNFPKRKIIASGGVSGIKDIKSLAGIADGVIFGKAFYEGKISPQELLCLKKG